MHDRPRGAGFAGIIAAVSLLSFVGAAAQPVIEHANDFSIGEQHVFARIDQPTLGTGKAGKGVAWDFRSLGAATDTVTQTIVDPKGTVHGDAFPSATYAESNSDGAVIYQRATPVVTVLLGFSNDASGVLMTFRDSVPMMVRPLAFGTKITTRFRRTFTASGFEFHGRGVATVSVDAFGTLRLADRTFTDVMRVRIEQVGDDTTDGGNATHTRAVTYVWFDAAHHSALLKLDSTSVRSGTFKRARYSGQVLVREVLAAVPRPAPAFAARGSAPASIAAEDFTDLAGECDRRIGLLQEGDLGRENTVTHHRVVGVAAREEDANVGILLRDDLRELASGH